MSSFEVFVVDNQSDDQTADAVSGFFPRVRLLRSPRNMGAVARNLALPQITTPFTVFLDDDSFPMPGSVRRMLLHFDTSPRLGAAVFSVVLPDGRQECSAYPDVFIGCGTGFRTTAIRDAGGLPQDFFMQAEEYDLSLRLMDLGWEIRRFDDLFVHHLKSPVARASKRTTRLDVRNNLLLVGRRFPKGERVRFAIDWTKRYWWIAKTNGHQAAFLRGLIEGTIGNLRGRSPVSRKTFIQFSRREEIRTLFVRLIDCQMRQIVLIDLGKHVTEYVNLARSSGIDVLAIADNRLALSGRKFRNIPVVTDQQACEIEFDAAVVANLSPVNAAARREAWRHATGRPVFDVLEAPDELTVRPPHVASILSESHPRLSSDATRV